MKKSTIIAGVVGLLALGTAGGVLLAMNHHGDRHSSQMHPQDGSGHGEGHHSPETMGTLSQVKLVSQATAIAQTPLSLELQVQDAQGKAIADFETFQEKLMHLIVVSDDLQVFQHLHPQYNGQGIFKMQMQLPQGGNYTLFSDYKPKGLPEQVSTIQLQANGSPVPVSSPNFSTQEQVDTTLVGLKLPPEGLKAGISQEISFQLKDATNNQAVNDLQPYLGSQGHLVIVRQSQVLDRGNYIHAHALPSTKSGNVTFHTTFPEPGIYKIWGQFQRNGKAITIPFWIKV